MQFEVQVNTYVEIIRFSEVKKFIDYKCLV